MPKLNRDVTLNAFGVEITLPKGTDVHLVKGLNGLTGDGYAVSSVQLLIKLTGNGHDPRYRYIVVPNDAVDAS